MNAVAAVSTNWGLGKNNDLLFHISEDMKHFRTLTSGGTVIMGRKTLASMPGGKALPKRRNIVITRNAELTMEGCEMASSLEGAIAMCAGEEEVCVIGGGEIYRQAMPLADKLYITHVDLEVEGDTRFPDIDPAVWHEVSHEDFPHGSAFPHPFSFVDYERK